MRIEWTCDPAQTPTLVKRVFDEIGFVKSTSFSSDQVGRIQQALLRDFERNSQENGYLLNQISGAYEDGDAADVASALDLPRRIAAMTPAGPGSAWSISTTSRRWPAHCHAC